MTNFLIGLLVLTFVFDGLTRLGSSGFCAFFTLRLLRAL